MTAPPLLWAFRVLWLVLPFTVGTHIDAATADATSAVALAAASMFWLLWAVGFVASLVALPSTLTLVRVLAPMAPAAAVAAVADTTPDAAAWVGLAVSGLVAIVAMASAVGDWFVDGPSYGDERRMALRPPVALLLGPLQLTWLLVAVPLPVGVLVVAAGNPLVGVPLVVVGAATAWWGTAAMWRLARRWAVFVPAGLTLVDSMALAEPILLPARAMVRVGPALRGTEALDLTVAAPGLVIEVAVDPPVELVPAVARGGVAEPTTTAAVLVVPSRPASLLDVAESRGLPVERG